MGPLKLLNLTKTDGGWIVEAEGHNSAVCPDSSERTAANRAIRVAAGPAPPGTFQSGLNTRRVAQYKVVRNRSG